MYSTFTRNSELAWYQRVLFVQVAHCARLGIPDETRYGIGQRQRPKSYFVVPDYYTIYHQPSFHHPTITPYFHNQLLLAESKNCQKMDDVFEFLHNADEQLEKHGNAIEAATKVGCFFVTLSRIYPQNSYLNLLPILNHMMISRSITKLFI